MKKKTINLYYSDKYLVDMGNHPFDTYKYKSIVERLLEEQLIKRSQIKTPKKLTYEELNTVHTTDYLEDVLKYKVTPRTISSELPVKKEVIDAFLINVSGTVRAAESALKNMYAVNIGGGFHHAFHHRAEGFCYFNDIALAARILRNTHKVGKILIIDLDLHQGNGTAFILQTDKNIFTFSMHQENNYPPKEKSSYDIGLLDGMEDEEYLFLLDDALKNINKKFKADYIIYIAGGDVHKNDVIGGLNLSTEGIKRRDEKVINYALDNDIPMVITLAGGYYKEIVDIHLNTIKSLLSALDISK